MLYGLSEKTINTLHSIFIKYSGIKQAVLYGSRAKGKFRAGSDIDLTLKTDNSFSRKNLLCIENDFDDSDLPYFVDISIYEKLSNPDLKAHIDRMGKVLYTVSQPAKDT